MKISNPQSFGSYSCPRLLNKNDILRMYSHDHSTWHFEKDSEDEWVRYSFDGGETWTLEFKFNSRLVFSSLKSPNPPFDAQSSPFEKGNVFVFNCEAPSDEQWEAIKASTPLFFSTNGEWITSISSFRYKFNDSSKNIEVMFLENLPSDTTDIFVKLMFTSGDSMLLNASNSMPFITQDITPENTNGTASGL